MILNISSFTSIFEEKRKKGDLSVRMATDELGADLYREREKNNKYEISLREQLLPEIPGFEAEKLLNRYYQDRFLDGLVKLRYRAQKSQMDTPISAGSELAWGMFGAIVNLNPFEVGEVVNRIWDSGGDSKEVRNKLMQEFYKKCGEFILLSNSIMLNERMNWISYVEGEKNRAYMSHNRLEWFSLGTAGTGYSQQVENAVAEMELAYVYNSAKYRGAKLRRSGEAHLDLFGQGAEAIGLGPVLEAAKQIPSMFSKKTDS